MFKCVLITRIRNKINKTVTSWQKEVDLFVPPAVGHIINVCDMYWDVENICQNIDDNYVEVHIDDMCNSDDQESIELSKKYLTESGWKEFEK